jgi:ribosomal protein S18 acetylase RimI-like enzyme
MTSDFPQPIRLEKKQFDAAAHLFGQSFTEDPFMCELLPDPSKRANGFATLSRCVLQFGAIYGEVQVTSPKLEGVAIWIPSEHCELSLWGMVRIGMWRLPFSLGLRATQIAVAYADYAKHLRMKYMQGRYWYLQLLAVQPEHRGAGHSSVLLRSMLARMDREGLACCLDTENEKNVAMYEHFGFRVLDKGVLPGYNSPIWFMGRAPNGASL